jgi:hypothetical protein
MCFPPSGRSHNKKIASLNYSHTILVECRVYFPSTGYYSLTRSLTRSLLSFFYYSILHMDFFGLGSATEMETPLGLLVKSATDPLLLGPDWAKNLEICDSISSLPEA